MVVMNQKWIQLFFLLKSNEALYKQITRKGTAEEEKEKLLDEIHHLPRRSGL